MSGEELESYEPVKLGVFSPINHTHAALTKLLEDLVVTDGRAHQDVPILALRDLTRIRGENKRSLERPSEGLPKALLGRSKTLFTALRAISGGRWVSVKII